MGIVQRTRVQGRHRRIRVLDEGDDRGEVLAGAASVVRHHAPTTEQLRTSLKTQPSVLVAPTDSNPPQSPTKKPRRSRSSSRGNQFEIWAWVELNYRPHAYQDSASVQCRWVATRPGAPRSASSNRRQSTR